MGRGGQDKRMQKGGRLLWLARKGGKENVPQTISQGGTIHLKKMGYNLGGGNWDNRDLTGVVYSGEGMKNHGE